MMELKEPTTVKTDVLIIGGGGAGLRAAIEVRKAGVKALVVAKSRAGYACNTAIAGGGLSAVTPWQDAQDSPEAHVKDTIVSGRFINDRPLVEALAGGGTQAVRDLVSFGVAFGQKDGQVVVAPFPGHTYPRNIRGAAGLGHDYTLPLRDYALKLGTDLSEGVWITHILKRDGVVVGAVGIDRQGRVLVFQSKAVILATGGAGQIYLNNNNAACTTGDGYALAYKLGLPLRDMEFVQFYPAALGRLGKTNVIYEHLVVGLGATLRNSLGEDIPEKHGIKDPALMTRDRVARAIFQEITEGRGVRGGVVMDLTTIPPQNTEKARRLLPPSLPRDRDRLLVAPTCHFFMGGVRINPQGETGQDGLWAAGEVGSGIHGANRLGGNAFAEIFVFGAITGREAAARAEKVALAQPAPGDLREALDDLESLASSRGGESEKNLREEMQKAMWRYAGIVREERGLKDCLEKLASIRQASAQVGINDPRELLRTIELRHMLIVSEMVCRAALMRTESRGSHFRSDYPRENDRDWLRNIFMTTLTRKPRPSWSRDVVTAKRAERSSYRLKPRP